MLLCKQGEMLTTITAVLISPVQGSNAAVNTKTRSNSNDVHQSGHMELVRCSR